MRNIKFANEEYYHICNRGVDKRKIFLDDGYCDRFLLAMDLLNDKEDGLMIAWRDYKKINPKAHSAEFLEPSSKRERLGLGIACFVV